MKIPKTLLWILLAAVIVGLAYGVVWLRRGISTRKDPSQTEIQVARALRHIAIPKLDRDEENPWKDVATVDVMKDAREHFANHCAQCHSNDGSGNTEMGKNLYPRAPDMRLPATQNLKDGEIYYIIRNGVPLTGMPSWGEPHLDQDDESWQLVLFIRHLPNLTPDEIKDMDSFNPKAKMEDEEEPTKDPNSANPAMNPSRTHQH
jgi:mono/diheme cytochrome c family protein